MIIGGKILKSILKVLITLFKKISLICQKYELLVI